MVVAALVAAAFAGQGCEEAHRTHQRVRRGDVVVVRTAVVACDGGRPLVLRRARWVNDGQRIRGTKIVRVAVAGRWLAWGELRVERRRTISAVGVRRRGEKPHVRVVGSDNRPSWVPELHVVVSSRGEVAWLTDGRVWLARGRGRARLVTRDAGYELRLEDDRTLRWRREIEGVRFFDLRPTRAGCPRRERYTVVAETPEIVVSRATYEFDLEFDEVIRACVRATGRDRVLAQFISVLDGDSGRVLAAAGRWVALLKTSFARGDPCAYEEVLIFDARSGARGRRAPILCDPGRAPGDPGTTVITRDGIPAWMASDPTRSAVITAARDGALVELDSGRPGAITGLVADGATVRWLHDGVPRSAPLATGASRAR